MRSAHNTKNSTRGRQRTRPRRACQHLIAGAIWLLGIAVGHAEDKPAAGREQGGKEEPTIEQPEAPVEFEAVKPGPRTPVSPTAVPVPDNLPDLSIMDWGIPPIRWGGNTTSNYNMNNSSNGSKTFSETETVNLRASSYIYQPWYAQVSGDLGLLTGMSRQNGGTDTSVTNSSRSTSATYGGNINVFPMSRFPFQAYLQTSDSRASANDTGAHYTSMRMGARQSYRPETGSENYTASVDRSIVTSSEVRSVVDAMQASYGTNIDNHGINASARYTSTSGDAGGQGSKLFGLTASHSWHADEDLSVATSASYTNNQISLLSGNGLSSNNSQMLQASSFATWYPDEDLPLTISGGGNFLHINTVTDNASLSLNSLNGYANANYRFSNNLLVTAGLTAAQNVSNGSSQFSTGQSVSVSYSGNPLTFGEYSYNWGTGGGISNLFISTGKPNHSVSGQIQHSLLRNVILSESSALTLNASQGFSAGTSTSSGQTNVLTHSGGLSWRLGVGEQTSGMMTVTVSDSRSSGSFPSHFRSLSTQGNIQTQLSSHSALAANVNFVLSQQITTPLIIQTEILPGATPGSIPTTIPTQPSKNDSTTLNGAGQITYSHRNPFRISNLFYSATLMVNASQSNLRLVSGDPNTLVWQTGKVLQQNADYRVGRLSFRLTNSFSTLNGKKNASLFFMIGREFGDF
jgi:hypothetical protein